jgi:hypothetical protein
MNGVHVLRAARRSCFVPTALAVLVALAVLLVEKPARADDERPRAYFYKDLPYGSQSLFNPIYAIVNRGYDAYQLRSDKAFGQTRSSDVENVWENFSNPFPALAARTPDGKNGWGAFLTREVFPLSFGQHTARWVPNYTLHLLGGGQTFAAMREWFISREAPPILASFASAAALYAAAFVNESVENKGVRHGFNTDCIADLWVFDLGGIVLFSFEAVRRFTSEVVTISDWSLQPAITYPHGDLHNVGSYYSLKVPLPFQERVKLFAFGGYETLGGLSVKLDREYSLSAAGGVRISTFENAGGTKVSDTYILLRPSGGVFLDRNESLLASVRAANITDYTVSINVYPNAFFTTSPGLGGWTAIGQDGKWIAGVSFTGAFGLGFGMGTR